MSNYVLRSEAVLKELKKRVPETRNAGQTTDLFQAIVSIQEIAEQPETSTKQAFEKAVHAQELDLIGEILFALIVDKYDFLAYQNNRWRVRNGQSMEEPYIDDDTEINIGLAEKILKEVNEIVLSGLKLDRNLSESSPSYDPNAQHPNIS